jgi:eukaryotic-like serine/threonine-protein kinase
MAALKYLTSILFCIGATAGTYLVMHLYIAPRLQAPPVEVPPLQGLTVEQARGLCDPRGLLLVIDGERVPEGDRVAPGKLFDQHPLGGSRLRAGEKVHATVALAVPGARVPALAGKPAEDAKRLLKEAGLEAGAVSEVPSDTVPAGVVVRSQPEAGAEARREQAVELFVSKGGEQVAVPNLRGRGARAAQKLLEQAGLALGEQHRIVDDNADDGGVLRQSPPAGTLLARGQKVDLFINE